MSIIRTEEKITSYIFYNRLVPQVLEKLNNMKAGEDFIFDLSMTRVVDAMAVPLLLNMARWIINRTEIMPQIYISNLKENEVLKMYLEKSGFFDTCDFYDYFEVNTERIFVKKDTSNLVTYIFTENAKDNSQEERERIEECVYKKLNNNSYSQFWEYWKDYDISQNTENPENVVEGVTRAVCANTGIHTQENAILTLQRNKKLHRVCVSIADCGQGLYATLKKKVNNNTFQPVLLPAEEFLKLNGSKADSYAIAEALAYRFMDKEYGLYHVLMKNIELGRESLKEKKLANEKWAMRIHTNQKRMVFTAQNCKGIEKTLSREQFANKILMLTESQYVAETTQNYPGVHIELEIPYDEVKM